jgi:hypothetical protein
MYEVDKWIQSLPNHPTFWILVALIIMVILMFVFAVTSPQGYEDDNGFHRGKPENKQK